MNFVDFIAQFPPLFDLFYPHLGVLSEEFYFQYPLEKDSKNEYINLPCLEAFIVVNYFLLNLY